MTPALPVVCGLALLLSSVPASAQEAGGGTEPADEVISAPEASPARDEREEDEEELELYGVERLDRIVAVVDEDPIFLSDLEGARALAGDAEASDRAILDDLIDQRLRAHEVDRYGSGRVGEDLVAAQVARILASRAEASGSGLPGQTLGDAELETLVRRQLRILAYAQERLGAMVYVPADAVRAYYEGTLREEMTRRGEQLPPLAEVEDAIRDLLHEQALDRRIARWTEELRQRADIVDLLASPMSPSRLPPVSLRLEADDAPTASEEGPWPPTP